MTKKAAISVTDDSITHEKLIGIIADEDNTFGALGMGGYGIKVINLEENMGVAFFKPLDTLPAPGFLTVIHGKNVYVGKGLNTITMILNGKNIPYKTRHAVEVPPEVEEAPEKAEEKLAPAPPFQN